ncbi:DUF6210 family protein [Lentzea sp. NPDC003310]|uniref:DUF6210 family protein n=1 Tax=Lentzea sp. NPDC003310 TaxID=3154447 RepID=UPI0033B8D27A
MRKVFLDPDGTQQDWLYVVVRARTGVLYEQQHGGTENRLDAVEGFLVPLQSVPALAELRALFKRRRLQDLRAVVAKALYWTDEPVPLRLDESREAEVAEAWVPVVTPDGSGVLMWHNSD